MRSFENALRKTFGWPGLRRSLIVALLVGSALNAINQGPELLSGNGPVVWKIALTYLVPFLVASYGSFAAFRQPGEEHEKMSRSGLS